MSKNSKRRKRRKIEATAQSLLKTQSQPATETALQSPNNSNGFFRIKKIVRLWWKKVFGVLTVLGVLCGLYEFFDPKVTVEAGQIFNPKNPLTARFTVKNDGELEIYHIHNHSIWIPMRLPNAQPIEFKGTRVWDKIAPESSTVCHYDNFPFYSQLPTDNNYRVQISIVFETKVWPVSITKTYRFTASKGSDGNFSITPYGEGQSDESFINDPTEPEKEVSP